MAIKLAFSTVACPDWTLEQVAEQAKAIGYEGVELRTLGPGGGVLSSDPALSDPEKVRAVLEAQGIEPVCLSTSRVIFTADTSRDTNTRWGVVQDLELAAQIGCPAVRVFGYELGPGRTHRTAIQKLAGLLNPIADRAADLGVQLLLENTGSSAREWWWLLNLLEHPMVGLSWNPANAAAADKNDTGGAVSVPVLSKYLRLAKVKDTLIGEGSGYTALGEGNVGIEPFIKRLLGVGFDGYVSVEWDRLWLPALTPADEYLPDAHQRLRGWLDAIAELVAKGEAAAAKMAKKNAPKTRAEAAGEK